MGIEDNLVGQSVFPCLTNNYDPVLNSHISLYYKKPKCDSCLIEL